MRSVGPNSFTEVYFPGCNPSFVETDEGIFMIDTPQNAIDAVRWREMLMERSKGRIRYLVNTEPHGDHIFGNCFFKDVPVIGHRLLQECFVEYTDAVGPAGRGMEARIEFARKTDPDSVWLLMHPDYQPYHGPTTIFEDKMTVELGAHTFHLIHTPGHTAPQIAVYVPEEGVVFTGDTVFCKCKTWLQDADPWLWLKALRIVGTLDVETIVPGHGEPCTKAYLKHQQQIIEDWLAIIEGWVERGLSEEEAVSEVAAVRAIDPYPPGQRFMRSADEISIISIRNLYRRVAARAAGRSSPDRQLDEPIGEIQAGRDSFQ